jgi:hypothetical protein
VGGHVKEANEKNLDENNFNSDGGSILSQALLPVTNRL